jgi:hypothetical protein
MKRLFHFAAMLALGFAVTSCDQGGPAEQNRQSVHSQPKSPARKCSLQHALDCKSFSELKTTPEFKAELLRFAKRTGGNRGLINDPFGIGYADDRLAHVPGPSKPRLLGNGMIFVESCPEHDCGDNGAAILKDGKIVALAAQYSRPPYREYLSNLEIYVEHKTRESAAWTEILKRWGLRGEKVQVYELGMLPPLGDPYSRRVRPDCSLNIPEACVGLEELVVSPAFKRELARFAGNHQGSYVMKNTSLRRQLDWAFSGDSGWPKLLGDGLVFFDTRLPNDRYGYGAAVILAHGRIVAAAAVNQTEWRTLDIFVERSTPETAKSIDAMQSWVENSNVRIHNLPPVGLSHRAQSL